MRRIATFLSVLVLLAATNVGAQSRGSKGPVIPMGGKGFKGMAGAGFTDFTVVAPTSDVNFDRGTYVAAAVERGFDFAHLYLVLTVSNMTATGIANYQYTNNTAAYAATDVAFRASMFDLGLGLKLKIIDDYWFRPYIAGGGLGGFHDISYTSKANLLAAQGDDYKRKDTIMGSGYYAEGGIEIEFTERFGVLLAARMSDYTTKPLETLNRRRLQFHTETYYFSALIGF